MILQLDPKLRLPDGKEIDLSTFYSENQAVKVLRPFFDEFMKKYPPDTLERLNFEWSNLFESRLYMKKYFLLDHCNALLDSMRERQEDATSDWVEEAGPAIMQGVTTTVMNHNQKPLQSIEEALVRCQNGTYGLDSENNLIDLARLWAVPHTTESVNKKLQRATFVNQN